MAPVFSWVCTVQHILATTLMAITQASSRTALIKQRVLLGMFCCSNGHSVGRRRPGRTHGGTALATPPDATEASPSVLGPADYAYNDTDGKGRKATIEHIFPALEGQKEADADRPLSPWQVEYPRTLAGTHNTPHVCSNETP